MFCLKSLEIVKNEHFSTDLSTKWAQNVDNFVDKSAFLYIMHKVVFLM